MVRRRKMRNKAAGMTGGLGFLLSAIALSSLYPLLQSSWAQEDSTEDDSWSTLDPIMGVTPKAKKILSNMSEYLASKPEFTVKAEVTYDSLIWDSQKIQFGGSAEAAVRRPDRLHLKFRGDERNLQAVFDGKKFNLLDITANVYTTVESESSIDAALDRVYDDYGVSIPLGDLIHSDPYATLMGSVQSGFSMGVHNVGGVPCDHLAFTQESIDWQIWIEAGPTPVPRKIVISYKDAPGSPQYTATYSDWNFSPGLAGRHFEFRPPEGADKIEFLPPEEFEE